MHPFNIPVAIAIMALAAWYVYRYVRRYNEAKKEQFTVSSPCTGVS